MLSSSLEINFYMKNDAPEKLDAKITIPCKSYLCDSSTVSNEMVRTIDIFKLCLNQN